MAVPVTIDEIREYVSDYAPNNYLIDGEEFSDTFITLCGTLAVDSFNTMTPFSRYSANTFPSKGLFLLGTCWHMFQGKAALLARNTMQYSDGGLQIPVEERSELYRGIAEGFRVQFNQASQALKIQMNMESGWGSIGSDEAFFPLY